MLQDEDAPSDSEFSDDEESQDDEEPQVDTRPLITPTWRQENPQEWKRLWDNRSATCPVCFEGDFSTDRLWDGPMNSDVPTRCTHWVCTECWREINDGDRKCPICRDDVSSWLRRYNM